MKKLISSVTLLLFAAFFIHLAGTPGWTTLQEFLTSLQVQGVGALRGV